LARTARAFDNDDHARSAVMSGRSRNESASGSAVAIPTTPAARNGPTQPEPRSSVAPATIGPSDPIPNPATAWSACAEPIRAAGDEELPRVPDVCADRADQRCVTEDAEIEVRALAGRLRESARADRRDRERRERNRAEDHGRPAPAERLEQETRREERERAAE